MLEFYNQANDIIVTTYPTQDLPDDVNCQFDFVHGITNSLVITENVAYVRGKHLIEPDPKETPESIRPERAIIEQILP